MEGFEGHDMRWKMVAKPKKKQNNSNSALSDGVILRRDYEQKNSNDKRNTTTIHMDRNKNGSTERSQGD